MAKPVRKARRKKGTARPGKLAMLEAAYKEALDRQTAIVEVLRVISASPGDLAPVFEAILRSAVNLCGAEIAAVFPFDGRLVHLGTTYNWTQEATDYFSKIYPAPPSETLMSGRTILGRAVVELPDAAADSHYDATSAITGQWRRMLGVPILREGVPLGAMVVCWREPGDTPQRQVDLLEAFASQAAIAIENVRLFSETKEALERQTATAEILRVISASPTDVKPVFQAIVERAAQLVAPCGAGLVMREGDKIVHQATTSPGANAEKLAGLASIFPIRFDPANSPISRAIEERQVVEVADTEAPGVPERVGATGRVARFRSVTIVPLVRDDIGIGAIAITHPEAGFRLNANQIALLKTFADQAVIAIENVRLFNEIQEKSRQLEDASRHKSHFLASMSHELRTPLNAILGFNEMILGGIYGDVPAEMTEPLRDISTSGKHLLRLINNVLDLAKIEAGRMELALADYSVHDTVAGVHATLRPLAAEKGLEFLCEVTGDIALARGDGGRIAQCLMNLAGNSLKFTKQGRVAINVQQENGLLRYSVTDTGIGIPPDKIGSLFTQFKQTDAAIASEYGGTGLGLSITKKFIEMHGGRIWIESELGKGSTFIFEVPLRVAP